MEEEEQYRRMDEVIARQKPLEPPQLYTALATGHKARNDKWHFLLWVIILSLHVVLMISHPPAVPSLVRQFNYKITQNLLLRGVRSPQSCRKLANILPFLSTPMLPFLLWTL